jgi:hypothetical protein
MTQAEQLIQQGLNQGVQQGLQQGLQEAVADVLETRFGDIFSSSLKKKLECIADYTILESLLQKAVTIDTLAELEEEITTYLP